MKLVLSINRKACLGESKGIVAWKDLRGILIIWNSNDHVFISRTRDGDFMEIACLGKRTVQIYLKLSRVRRLLRPSGLISPPPPAFPTGKQSSLHLWIARQYTEGIAVKPAFLLLSYHIDPAETRWRHLSLDIWLFKVLITLDTSLYSTACSALYHYLSYYFTHKTESIGAEPAAKFSCWTN